MTNDHSLDMHFFLWPWVCGGMEMTLGESNPKQQKLEQGWETLSESQGDGFEQRSAGSALISWLKMK